MAFFERSVMVDHDIICHGTCINTTVLPRELNSVLLDWKELCDVEFMHSLNLVLLNNICAQVIQVY